MPQDLLFKFPQLITFEMIEPAFANSLPIAREMPVEFETSTGLIDLVFCNAAGYLTLVETKLWRNPESRRVVVAQLIGYASQIAKMRYADFSAAIDSAVGTVPDALIHNLKERHKDFDERRFHDTFSANLRRGRFLLLVIGDGIREGVDSMAEFLQGQPHLGFSLSLIEMALFRLRAGNDDSIVVQPRILLKTREVIRAVVELKGITGEVVVTTPPEPATGAKPKRFTLTAEDYYKELSENVDPETVEFARTLVVNASDHGLVIDWKQAGPVFKLMDEDRDIFFTLFQLQREGEIAEIFRFRSRCQELGLPDQIWKGYFDALVKLLPGGKLKTFKNGVDVIWDSDIFSLEAIRLRKDEWIASVDLAVRQVREWLAKQKR